MLRLRWTLNNTLSRATCSETRNTKLFRWWISFHRISNQMRQMVGLNQGIHQQVWASWDHGRPHRKQLSVMTGNPWHRGPRVVHNRARMRPLNFGEQTRQRYLIPLRILVRQVQRREILPRPQANSHSLLSQTGDRARRAAAIKVWL